jgi:hypothetical protein
MSNEDQDGKDEEQEEEVNSNQTGCHDFNVLKPTVILSVIIEGPVLSEC